MIAVHTRKQHQVDLAEPGTVWPGDGAARVIEDPRAVPILEDYRPVAVAELSVMSPDRGDLYVGGGRRLRAKPEHRHGDGGQRIEYILREPPF